MPVRNQRQNAPTGFARVAHHKFTTIKQRSIATLRLYVAAVSPYHYVRLDEKEISHVFEVSFSINCRQTEIQFFRSSFLVATSRFDGIDRQETYGQTANNFRINYSG